MKTKIILAEKAQIELPTELLKKIEQYLTISNPLFNKRLDLGLANWGIPSKLKFYNSGDDYLEAPIGILDFLVESGETELEFLDNRFCAPNDEFFSTLNFTGTLRDYQEDIIKACMANDTGVIEAMTGSGKTIVFINLTLKRKVNTLILVNTLELAQQVRDSFLKFTNIKNENIGLIGNGVYNIQPITVGLHQSLSNLPQDKYDDLNNHFGMIIADETHIIAADSFFKNMNSLKAKHKYGFSATPKRDDGLTEVIHFAVGKKIHTVPKEKLTDVLFTPTVVFVYTNYFFPLMLTTEYQDMINDLSADEERNALIFDTWEKNYKDDYTILLCNRLTQVDALREKFKDKALILTSAMKKKDREAVMNKLKNKEIKVIISTFGLFSTGIDLPHFNVLFMCAPIKSQIKVRQSAGRLMRKSQGKTKAIIVDFVDKKISLLYHHSLQRKKIFKNL